MDPKPQENPGLTESGKMNSGLTESPRTTPGVTQPNPGLTETPSVNPYSHWSRDNPNAFMDYNFIKVTEVGRDRVVTSLTIRPETRNPYGVAHGSALYTMADNATGIAAHTDGRSYVTQSSNMYFLNNQKEGTIRAEANVMHRGRTTCLVGVEITGDGGKRLASGTFIHFCVDQTVRPFQVHNFSA